MFFWRLVSFLVAIGAVLADTEIRNFHLPLAGERVVPSQEVIRITPHEQLSLTVSRSSPELWIQLDAPAGGYTTRVSWAASTPTKFDMEVYPDDTGALLRIRAQALSPRMPHPLLVRLGWISDGTKIDDSEFETPFHLVLEPLVLGVPATAGSAVAGVLVMAAIAALCAPKAIVALEGVVRELKLQESEKRD